MEEADFDYDEAYLWADNQSISSVSRNFQAIVLNFCVVACHKDHFFSEHHIISIQLLYSFFKAITLVSGLIIQPSFFSFGQYQLISLFSIFISGKFSLGY